MRTEDARRLSAGIWVQKAYVETHYTVTIMKASQKGTSSRAHGLETGVEVADHETAFTGEEICAQKGELRVLRFVGAMSLFEVPVGNPQIRRKLPYEPTNSK